MNGTRKRVNQHPRSDCYFCGSEGPIETHHVVPRRLDGSDYSENLVDLCPTCHERLERLYNNRFYDKLEEAFYPIKRPYEADEIESEKDSKENTPAQELKDMISVIEKSYDEGVPIDDLISAALQRSTFEDAADVKSALEKLRRKGDVYEPVQDNLRAC